MNYLIFDTETTGLVNTKHPYDFDAQPHLVQLACIIADNNFNIVSEYSCIVKPDGYEIPTQASDVHGITTEHAIEHGIDLLEAVCRFKDMLDSADTLVAHNIDFDMIVMRASLHRSEFNLDELIGSKDKYCTMQNCINTLKLPGRYGKYKWPKLAECYKHYTGNELDGAHDALIDTRACLEVLKHIKNTETKDEI